MSPRSRSPPMRRFTARVWVSIRSTSSRSPWSFQSSTASSFARTAKRMNTSSAPYDASSNTSPRTGQSRRLSTTLPLISHRDLDAVVAYRLGAPVLARHFLADVGRLAAALPAGGHVLNVCSDRYRFTVGFAASLVAGKVSLLPSTHTPQVIRQLTEFAPDVFCLTDDPTCEIDLPRVAYPEAEGAHAAALSVPEIDAGQLAAYVFTSGSTGTPLP